MDAAIAALVAAAAKEQAQVKRERAESSSDDEPPKKTSKKRGPKPKQRGANTKYDFRQPASPSSTNLSIQVTVELGEATLQFLNKVFNKETPAAPEHDE